MVHGANMFSHGLVVDTDSRFGVLPIHEHELLSSYSYISVTYCTKSQLLTAFASASRSVKYKRNVAHVHKSLC